MYTEPSAENKACSLPQDRDRLHHTCWAAEPWKEAVSILCAATRPWFSRCRTTPSLPFLPPLLPLPFASPSGPAATSLHSLQVTHLF